MDSICGRSGLGDGGTVQQVQLPGARIASGGVRPQFILLEEGSQGYKTDLNNVAPSASIAWRPDVQSGFLRKILGDPDQATLRAGYSDRLRPPGAHPVHRPLWGQPRRLDFADAATPTRDSCRRASRGRCCSRRPVVSPRVVQSGSDLSHRRRREPRGQPQRLHAGHQDRAACRPGRSASRGRSPGTWRSRSATSATAAPTSGRRSTTTAAPPTATTARHPRREPGRQRVHERVQAGDGEPPGQQRLGRREPGRLVRLLRRGTGTQPAAHLSGVPQWQNGCRQPGRLRLGANGRRSTPRPPRRTPRLPAGSPGRTRTPTARRSISTTT